MKRNIKIELFLKLEFGEQGFEKVQVYEKCIFKRNEMYVILTDRDIFLVNYPPKNIKLKLSLAEIKSINLLNDTADELFGESQESAQHIKLLTLPNDQGQSHSNTLNLDLSFSDNVFEAQKPGSSRSSTGPKFGDEASVLKEMSQESFLDSDDEDIRPLSQSLPSRILQKLKSPRLDTSSLSNGTNGKNMQNIRRSVLVTQQFLRSNSLRQRFSDSVSKKSSPTASVSESDGGATADEKSIDIFILDKSSAFYLMLSSKWYSYLMQSTSSFGTKDSVRSDSFSDSVMLMRKFNQLKQQFIGSVNGHRLDESFELLSELLQATLENCALKKFFWRSNELLVAIVSELKSTMKTFESDQLEATQCADHLEYCILIAELLLAEFQQTDDIDDKIGILQSNSGRLLNDLIGSLILVPRVTTKVPLSSHQFRSLLLRLDKSWSSLFKIDIGELLIEWNDVRSAVLYELLQTVKYQASWVTVDHSVMSSSFVIGVIQNDQLTCENFLACLVRRCFILLTGKSDKLSPSEAVTCYQIFSVIHLLLRFSPKISEFIHSTYSIDFKYQIRKSVIEPKISVEYPIGHLLRELVFETTRLIGQKNAF